MPTESRRRPWGRRDSLLGLGLGLAALGLAWTAAQGLTRELLRIPPNRFIELHETRLDSPEDAGRSRDKALELYERLPSWALGSVELRRLGKLWLLKALDERAAGGDADAAIAAGEAALDASLRLAPIQPPAWAYRADLARLRTAGAALACRVLKGSYAVAPVEPDFAVYRLGVALECVEHWDIELLGMIRRDVRALFAPGAHGAERRALVEVTREDRRLTAFVERLLRDDAEGLALYRRGLGIR
jgi:hypothetical protein